MKESQVKNKMSKRKKGALITLGVGGFLVVAVLIYGFVITNVGAYVISRFTPDTEIQVASFQSAKETTQLIAEEGIVLMQNNDNLLPLTAPEGEKIPINLFGMRAIQLVYNGGGSTATDVSDCVKLEDALRNNSFKVNEDLLHLKYNFFGTEYILIAPTSAPENQSASAFLDSNRFITIPEIPASVYSQTNLFDDGRTMIEHAHDFSNVAMIVIGRGGHESYDLTVSELQLTTEEVALFDAVSEKFDDIILVLNVANQMELNFLEDYPEIKSVLWIGFAGEAGTEAFARILNGTVNPSGRLANTWVSDNLSHPAVNNFLALSEDGLDWQEDSFHYEGLEPVESIMTGTSNRGFFNHYSEGIFVGYRYFETRHATDENFDYDAIVLFPFGYGLSYTTFEHNLISMNVEDDEITVRVSVENKGKVSGRDVIQIYYNPPFTGAIEKSTVNLLTFKKTNEIAPGDKEYYSLTFNIEQMASFDFRNHGSYVLEQGNYEIMLKENAHVFIDSEIFVLPEDIIYNDEHHGPRATDLQAAVSRLEDALGIDDYLTRDWDESSRAFTGPLEKDFIPSQDILDALKIRIPTDEQLNLTAADMPLHSQEFDEDMMFFDLIGIAHDDTKWDEFISQLTLEELSSLVANGAYQIMEIERLGVPRTLTPDGSAFIGATIYSGAAMGNANAGVTYPNPTVLAATWNKDLANLMGTSVGIEAYAHGFQGWYAPGMNTHRTPFNGRNFEYYSEDPILSGTMGGAVVQGATDKGLITFIKHFAMNERESNCRYQLMKWSNEQAIREIYLRPFEMAIKEGGALGIMTAFNYIGFDWAGSNENLLKDIVRNEWGFRGVIVTDANMYPHMDPVQMIYGGGDLSLDTMAIWMGGENQSRDLLAAATDSNTQVGTVQNLQRAAKNILYSVTHTWPMQD